MSVALGGFTSLSRKHKRGSVCESFEDDQCGPRLRHIREGKKLKLLLSRSPTRDPLTRINPRAAKRFAAAHLLVQFYTYLEINSPIRYS